MLNEEGEQLINNISLLHNANNQKVGQNQGFVVLASMLHKIYVSLASLHGNLVEECNTILQSW